MKNIASRIGAAAIVLALLFFGLKGYVVTIWKAPTEPSTYVVHGSDGRSLAMIFLPNHETIILYTEEKAGFIEAALTRMRGTYGTHYFWRLWGVQGPGVTGGLFGYRLYPDNARPVVMETTILKKFVHGSSTPMLNSEGDRMHPVIVFSDNAVRFKDMWLTKEPTDPQFVKSLLRQLKLKPQ